MDLVALEVSAGLSGLSPRDRSALQEKNLKIEFPPHKRTSQALTGQPVQQHFAK